MRAVRSALLGLAAFGCATAAMPQDSASQAAVALGRRIFHEGRNAQGEPVRALVGAGGQALAGPAVACANCHGADGRGRPEGGTVPPDINWEELTKPYGRRHASGRTRGPFDERSFARAVTEGIDPAGNRLDPVMPRYALASGELAALAAFLRVLAHERDPGVLDDVIRIGTVLPQDGPAAAVGTAVSAMLRAYVADLNARGGVHGRRVELVEAADPGQAARRFSALPVFALVSPYGGGAGDSLAQLASERELPMIAPLLASPTREALPWTFYLYPGETEIARVLLGFAQRASAGAGAWAVLVDDTAGATATAMRDECARRGCERLEVVPAASAADAARVEALRRAGVDRVIFAGPDSTLLPFLHAADRSGWHPAVYVPGSGAVRALLSAPSAFTGRLFAAYWTRPDLFGASAAARAFDRLRRERGLGERYTAAQAHAYASMAIVEEVLRVAGRDLSRQRFVRALEGLHRFDAGPLPPLSFGPGRRVGALGAYVVQVDGRNGIRPVSEWIALESR